MRYLVSCIFLLTLSQGLYSTKPSRTPPAIIAHRGASDVAPENTLTAFRKAVEFGADVIEMDIQLTLDGVPVVIHDNSVQRVTSDLFCDKVSDLNATELAALDVGSWFSSDYLNEKIPTLRDVLRESYGSTGLMIEMKYGHYTGVQVAQAALKELHRTHLPGSSPNPNAWLASTSVRALQHVRQEVPQHQVIGIASNLLDLSLFVALGVQRLAISSKLAHGPLVNRLQQRGVKTWVWTVDAPSVAFDLYNSGVHGIISNRAGQMTKHLRPQKSA